MSYQNEIVHGVMADSWINKMCAEHGMISPFEPQVTGKDEGKISYGCSSYGYDIRVADEFYLFDNSVGNTILSPKEVDERAYRFEKTDVLIIPPHGFALAKSVETFNIPRSVLVLCMGKSSYARVGVIVNITPLEPEWKGVLTIEISNTTPFPVKIFANEGIAQLGFFGGNSICETSYADRAGKYQGQTGITLPKA